LAELGHQRAVCQHHRDPAGAFADGADAADVLETLIGVALALAIAFVRGSLTDRLVMIACTVGMSVSILVYIIVFQYGWPTSWAVPGAGLGRAWARTCCAMRPCRC
jgi:peptide/nickel transport system permease protein